MEQKIAPNKGVQHQDKPLTEKEALFVRHYLRCGVAKEAAQLAGYTTKSDGQMANLLKKKAIRKAIDDARAVIVADAVFDMKASMAELDDIRLRSIDAKQFQAAVRASEMKARVAGLVIDRVDQRTVGSFSINISGIGAPVIEAPPRNDDVIDAEVTEVFKT